MALLILYSFNDTSYFDISGDQMTVQVSRVAVACQKATVSSKSIAIRNDYSSLNSLWAKDKYKIIQGIT